MAAEAEATPVFMHHETGLDLGKQLAIFGLDHRITSQKEEYNCHEPLLDFVNRFGFTCKTVVDLADIAGPDGDKLFHASFLCVPEDFEPQGETEHATSFLDLLHREVMISPGAPTGGQEGEDSSSSSWAKRVMSGTYALCFLHVTPNVETKIVCACLFRPTDSGTYVPFLRTAGGTFGNPPGDDQPWENRGLAACNLAAVQKAGKALFRMDEVGSRTIYVSSWDESIGDLDKGAFEKIEKDGVSSVIADLVASGGGAGSSTFYVSSQDLTPVANSWADGKASAAASSAGVKEETAEGASEQQGKRKIGDVSEEAVEGTAKNPRRSLSVPERPTASSAERGGARPIDLTSTAVTESAKAGEMAVEEGVKSETPGAKDPASYEAPVVATRSAERPRSVAGKGASERIAEAGGVRILLNVLSQMESVSVVQENILAVLAKGLTLDGNEFSRLIMKDGGVTRIVHALKLHIDNVNVQLQALAVLEHLTATTHGVIHDASGIQAILSSMKSHEANVDIQGRGCIVLASLAESKQKHAAVIVKAGGVQIIVAAIRAHSLSAHIAFTGTHALATMAAAKNRAEVKKAVMTRGGTQAIIESMTNHGEVDKVVEICVTALNSIVKIGPEAKKIVHQCGGIQEITAVLKKGRGDAKMKTWACDTLAELIVDVDAAVVARDAGCLPAVMELMREHPDDESLQGVACHVIFYLYRYDKAIRADQSGMISLLAAMKRHPTDWAVQLGASGALGYLTDKNTGNQDAVREAGGIQLIVAALQAHANADVQNWACYALSTLSEKNQANQAAIEEAGGIAAVVEAMRKHSADAELQQDGCTALGNLCEARAEGVTNASGIEAVIEAMSNHPEHTELMKCASQMLRQATCGGDL